jgi:radical SAM protein with 4Fe4S-binding SPASM domain
LPKERAFADGILLMPGNNLGFFGPEEALLRSGTADGNDHFRGCMAGRYLMGIESNGDVKGCPSLQSQHYVGASLKQQPLKEAWQSPVVGYSRDRKAEDALWGFCKTCVYAETCMGGCTFTAHAILGRPGNNPYCHHRALVHQKRGEQEHLVLVEGAPGEPFDNGRFEVRLEPLGTVHEIETATKLVKIRKPHP